MACGTLREVKRFLHAYYLDQLSSEGAQARTLGDLSSVWVGKRRPGEQMKPGGRYLFMPKRSKDGESVTAECLVFIGERDSPTRATTSHTATNTKLQPTLMATTYTPRPPSTPPGSVKTYTVGGEVIWKGWDGSVHICVTVNLEGKCLTKIVPPELQRGAPEEYKVGAWINLILPAAVWEEEVRRG